MGLMSAREVLWKNIIADMRANGQVGRHLTLTCRNHPQNIIHASRSADFRKAPAGGCMEPCVARLDCGHVCKSYCHPADPEHKKYKCPEKCTKMLCEIHKVKCHKLCWKACGRCKVLVTREIPDCKHKQEVQCFLDPKEFKCQALCQRLLACGLHHCKRKCSDTCPKNCTTKVQKMLKCGHENTVECYKNIDEAMCKTPCHELLKCGHPCQGTCGECFQGRLHLPCKAKCDRSLFCGHLCREDCTRNCPPCSQPCENKCFHSKCMNKCGERCVPCVMKCKWQCKHYKCSKPCSETCDRPRCNKGCRKKLRCGHRCIGMCGEPCPKKCRVCNKDEVNKIVFGNEDKPYARFVELQPCGHVIEKNAMDHYMDDVSNDSSIIQLKG
ncbi:NFX1-type zinc finger-containing protein 1 [Exaiptasia diaphana]|uniref:TNFR-Cys domain-containing protein n=1 Tax=Exaiptasia diaphana TaxID=2652724 RepID=A0A913YCV2_EXADI|nr:NFX1-type zinc finger-containing protein 1 [Exaiptasia diaphana]